MLDWIPLNLFTRYQPTDRYCFVLLAKWLQKYLQENDNTPLEHTPGNPPSQLWKESLYSLLVKV